MSLCVCVCLVRQVIVHEVPGQELEVEVYDKDPDQDDFLGRYKFMLLMCPSSVIFHWQFKMYTTFWFEPVVSSIYSQSHDPLSYIYIELSLSYNSLFYAST